jgi:hypothetical protein
LQLLITTARSEANNKERNNNKKNKNKNKNKKKKKGREEKGMVGSIRLMVVGLVVW